MSRTQKFSISAIVTQNFVEGAISPSDFIHALQSFWTSVTYQAVDVVTPLYHYILDWSIAQLPLHGQLADEYYRLDFTALPADAAAFALWYRQCVPATCALAFSAAGAYEGRYIELTATTDVQDILTYIATCRNKVERSKHDPSLATYHLRVTRTDRRRRNQRLYLIERLEQNEVVNQSLETRLDVGIRLLVEQGVPVHTNIREFAELCERVGTYVYPLPQSNNKDS